MSWAVEWRLELQERHGQAQQRWIGPEEKHELLGWLEEKHERMEELVESLMHQFELEEKHEQLVGLWESLVHQVWHEEQHYQLRELWQSQDHQVVSG